MMRTGQQSLIFLEPRKHTGLPLERSRLGADSFVILSHVRAEYLNLGTL
jgi:hypothetical protein